MKSTANHDIEMITLVENSGCDHISNILRSELTYDRFFTSGTTFGTCGTKLEFLQNQFEGS